MKDFTLKLALVILGASATLLFYEYKTLIDKNTPVQEQWGASMKAVDSLAQTIVKWANLNGRLPESLELLHIPPDCNAAIYLRPVDVKVQEAIIAYPIKETPQSNQGPIFTYITIQKNAGKHSVSDFTTDGMGGSTWVQFNTLLAGKKWLLEAVEK